MKDANLRRWCADKGFVIEEEDILIDFLEAGTRKKTKV